MTWHYVIMQIVDQTHNWKHSQDQGKLLDFFYVTESYCFLCFMFPQDVCDGFCGVLCPSEERQFKSLHCLLFFG